MWIKILLLVALIAIAFFGLRAPRGARHVAMRRMAVLLFAAFAVATVLFPEVWTAVANAVGVDRGTDLLLYLLIVVFMGYMASSYFRSRELESKITQLARHVALAEARSDEVIEVLRVANLKASEEPSGMSVEVSKELEH